MSTWEDLDDTLSNEDDEEANICLMADTTSEESELDQEDEVNFNDIESLRKGESKGCDKSGHENTRNNPPPQMKALNLIEARNTLHPLQASSRCDIPSP
ncbi:hypothetical protein JHK85_025167 [Glycine max]|nr:hypothetical protein JHK85_025167 [Glycine max]KAG5012409.1 hypothetical protein JHK86_024670 [Glycine max]